MEEAGPREVCLRKEFAKHIRGSRQAPGSPAPAGRRPSFCGRGRRGTAASTFERLTRGTSNSAAERDRE